MTSKSTPVLVAGATGMLGARIAHALLDTNDADLRLLIRKESLADPRKNAGLAALTARGAQIVEGDLADPKSLERATQGVEVVVSAVQGGWEVIVEGQLALLEAVKRNGVRRMLPSDFAVDLFAIPMGKHAFLNIRREADEAISKAGIENVHVLNGAFMDTMLEPFIGMIDTEAGEGRFWGTGDEPIDLTSVEDTARFTAAAALDRTLPSGKFAVAGEVTTFRRAIEAFGRATGRKLVSRSLGGVSDLEAWIAAQQAAEKPILHYVAAQYLWAMASGIGKLTDLQNGRYPQIKPETFEGHVTRTRVGARAAA